jgi:hypothetical protein
MTLVGELHIEPTVLHRMKLHVRQLTVEPEYQEQWSSGDFSMRIMRPQAFLPAPMNLQTSSRVAPGLKA